MATNRLHRIILIIPEAQRVATTNWWVNNIDPNGADTFSQGLSPTGTLPITHRRCCTGLTNAQLRAVLVRLGNAAGISLPANFDDRTRQQKRAWIVSQIQPIDDAIGVRLWFVENDAEDWGDVEESRVMKGLQVVNP